MCWLGEECEEWYIDVRHFNLSISEEDSCPRKAQQSSDQEPLSGSKCLLDSSQIMFLSYCAYLSTGCAHTPLFFCPQVQTRKKRRIVTSSGPLHSEAKTALFGEESQSLLSNAEANKFQQPEGSKSFNRFSACGQKQAPGTALPGGDSQRGRTKSCRAGQRHCPSLL